MKLGETCSELIQAIRREPFVFGDWQELSPVVFPSSVFRMCNSWLVTIQGPVRVQRVGKVCSQLAAGASAMSFFAIVHSFDPHNSLS